MRPVAANAPALSLPDLDSISDVFASNFILAVGIRPD
jgi:hypothetical protein